MTLFYLWRAEGLSKQFPFANGFQEQKRLFITECKTIWSHTGVKNRLRDNPEYDLKSYPLKIGKLKLANYSFILFIIELEGLYIANKSACNQINQFNLIPYSKKLILHND